MRNALLAQSDTSVSLMPYQMEFVGCILNQVGNRITLLRGDVGLGKTTTLAVAASRILAAKPDARVLILCPSRLCYQWADSVRREGSPALCVDRYKFREMLDIDTESALWPVGVVNILSYDFAKKSDVQESLASVSWDLLVVDEAHQLTRLRRDLFRRIEPLAKRVVLATAISATELSVITNEINVVDWTRENLLDHEGQPLFPPLNPEFHDLRYTLTPPELRIREALRQLAKVLESSDAMNRFRVQNLVKSFQSSVATLEGRLEGFLATSKDIVGSDEPGLELEDDDVELEAVGPPENPLPEQAKLIAVEILRELEELKVDSKLDFLGMLLKKIAKSAPSPRCVLIQTEYVATLYYLAADLDGRETPCEYIHGRMTLEARLEALERWSEGNGVLIATSAAREGINMPNVTDLILYDGPKSETTMKVILSPFQRYGRKATLENVYVLEAS